MKKEIKRDRRKEKPITREPLNVSIQIGTKEKILKITNNLSQFVDDAIDEYLKKFDLFRE